MKYGDISAMIVGYNFVVGVLVMLASEKVGAYAGLLNRAHRDGIMRLTRLSVFTFGAVVAVLSGGIYVLVHRLHIGV